MNFSNSKFTMILAEKQIDLSELCEKANIGVTTLRRIRKGESTPRPATIGRIAKALGVDVRDIIQEGDDHGTV